MCRRSPNKIPLATTTSNTPATGHHFEPGRKARPLTTLPAGILPTG